MRKPGPKSKSATSRSTTNKMPSNGAPPSYLSSRAKTIWKENVIYVKDGVSGPRAPLFATWCQLVETIEKCYKALNKKGHTMENGVGVEVPRPEVKILNDSEKLLLSYSRNLEMTKAVEIKQESSDPTVDYNGNVVDMKGLSETQKRRMRLFGRC